VFPQQSALNVRMDLTIALILLSVRLRASRSFTETTQRGGAKAVLKPVQLVKASRSVLHASLATI
jgi:hypothetical protein